MLFAISLVAGPLANAEVKTLSPLWAQEYIGADIVRLEMGNRYRSVGFGTYEAVLLKEMDKTPISDALAAIDKKCVQIPSNMPCGTKHGTAGTTILSSDYPESISALGKLVVSNQPGSENLDPLVKLLKSEQPEVFNVSALLTESDHNKIYAAASESMLSVQSAGNTFPRIDHNAHYDDERSIYVSNFSPLGLIQGDSTDTPHSFIGVPCGSNFNFETALGAARFGGTSCASPVLGGVLLNLRAILPEITQKEVIQILKTTQISITPKVAMANAYKIWLVAQKLEKDWPSSRAAIFQADLYDFSAEKAAIQGEDLFSLRKRFLLDPSNKDIRNKIAQHYQDAGFTANALFYRKLGQISYSETLELIANNSFDFPAWSTLFRHARAFPEYDANAIEKLLLDLIHSERIPGRRKWFFIEDVSRYLQLMPFYLAKSVLTETRDLEAKNTLLRKAYDLFGWGWKRPDVAMALFEIGIKDQDPKVREQALRQKNK